MVDFVLDIGGLDIGEVFADGFETARLLVLESDRVSPVDKTPEPGNGETAFKPAVFFLL